MKKNLLKINSLIMTFVIIISVGIISTRAETTVPATEPVNSVDSTVSFEEYFGTDVKLNTSAFETFSLMVDASAFDKLQYEVPEATPNLDRLNVEYSLMTSKMNSMGYGTNYKIDVPEFKKGYSSSISNYFADTFGDTSVKKGNAMSMPEGWTVSNIMNAASEQRNIIANSYKDSLAYKEMSSVMSTSNIFNAAKQTMSMPQNATIGSLASQLSNYNFSVGGNSAELESSMKNKYNASIEGIRKVGTAKIDFDIHKQSVDYFVSSNQPSADEVYKTAVDAFNENPQALHLFNSVKNNAGTSFVNGLPVDDKWEEIAKEWSSDLFYTPIPSK